jgi:hypothetical protein
MRIDDLPQPIILPPGVTMEMLSKSIEAMPSPLFSNNKESTGTLGVENNSASQVDIEKHREQLKMEGRKCWEVLHSMTQPSKLKIAKWLKTVPSIDCGCRRFAIEYVHNNPPPCDDSAKFFEWTWKFHCMVDRKTGDAPMTLEEARQRWHQIGTN